MNAGACNEPRQGSLSHCLPSNRICDPTARSPASDSANWHQGEGPRHFSWVASYSRVRPPLKDSWRGITSHSHLDCSSIVNVFLKAGLIRPKGEHPFLIITAPMYKDWTERPLAYTHTLQLLPRLNGSDSFNLSAKILLAHFHHVHGSSLDPSQNPYPFLVFHLGLDKSLVLSSLTVLSLVHPESCEVFNTGNAALTQAQTGKGRDPTHPTFPKRSCQDDLLEEKREQDQVGKGALAQDPKRQPRGHRPQWKPGGRDVWGRRGTRNSEQFHQHWVLAFKWQYPNQRGNDTAFQAKLHTFRQAKKITIKVQIYSACVIMIIITSGPI